MKKSIPSLNGLRALSILFVLFSHVQSRSFGHNDSPGGQIGVTIFFIISGYLITLLLKEEERKTGTISLTGFYLRRTLRIFPAYYFLLLIYFILSQLDILHFTSASWFTSLTYTKYLKIGNNSSDWPTGHFWSLSIEEHFYLIWPLVFTYLPKYRKVFAFLIIATIPVVRLCTDISEMHMLTRADSLMIGCTFALYNEFLIDLVKKANKFSLYLPFVILLVILAFKRILTIMSGNHDEHFIKAFFGSYGTITNISIGFIILISITYRDNLWFKFLNNKVMNFLGLLSYSLYLWQQLFFAREIAPLSNFPMNLAFIAVAALLSYYIIEKPFLKFKERLKKVNKENYNNLVKREKLLEVE